MEEKRQIKETCFCNFDHLADSWYLVAGEVVYDYDGGWPGVGDENLLNIDFEGVPVDRSIEDPGGDDAGGGNPGDKGRGLPMAVRNSDLQTLSTRTAAVAAGHVGRSPGLIDEDEALGIKRGLAVEPILPPRHDIWPVLLTRVRGLFLRVMPCLTRKRRMVPSPNTSPFLARLRRSSSIVISGVPVSIARIVS